MAQDGVDRVLGLGRALRRRKPMVAEAVGPVKPVRVAQRPDDRGLGALVDGDVRPADFRGEERVAGRLIERDIAGDRRQPQHPHIGRRERHDDRDGVVGGGVGVDEEVAHGPHAVAFSRAKPRSRSACKSPMSSRPIEKRSAGPPGAHIVAVR